MPKVTEEGYVGPCTPSPHLGDPYLGTLSLMQERQRFQALSYEAQPVDLFQRLLPFSFTKSDRYNCSSQRKSAVGSYRAQAAFSPDGVNVRCHF
jgi:hypothetical protein